jgi:tetratricopeptide (TPR) repeat protein
MVFSPERGLSLMNSGRSGEAIKLFSRALRDEKRFESFALRAEAFYLVGNLESSLSDYNSAIDLEQGNSQLFCNRAVINTKLGHFTKAISGLFPQQFPSKCYRLTPSSLDRLQPCSQARSLPRMGTS